MSVTAIEKRPASDAAVRDEAGRRRTFAAISHPDAGKSTLTEAVTLHRSLSTRRARCTAKPGGATPSISPCTAPNVATGLT